ncbi:hypothetical protein GOX01_20850 [Gluconobacter oxydans]|uniref:Uncharacterized protein n=1 Tax=Gluconobacter oxydans TaxID=442 RepID=A0AB35AQJ8_GLUOY|nr:hypothetical protein [Gluconobacter oxydans]KXV35889.1 hypothetical protein AD939_01140 [Gluconobacter oxydans]MBF0857214.1 hypothetical protein [Gluconobacter oxydans]TCW22867.1 hypothetical protein EDC20_1315 [Gluconobacter oxydans]GEC61754.1 hypothetical protein GOX01_20850 [Gluconobacter oxydans]
MTFFPFEEGRARLQIDDLAIENGAECIAVSGRLEIRRDRIGLQDIQALKAQIDAIARELEGSAHLPDRARVAREDSVIPNPFADRDCA